MKGQQLSLAAQASLQTPLQSSPKLSSPLIPLTLRHNRILPLLGSQDLCEHSAWTATRDLKIPQTRQIVRERLNRQATRGH
jgi:hypothetical protein